MKKHIKYQEESQAKERLIKIKLNANVADIAGQNEYECCNAQENGPEESWPRFHNAGLKNEFAHEVLIK